MDYILNHYLEGDGDSGNSIVKDPSELANRSFEDYVLSLVKPYIGMSDSAICHALGIPYTNNKAQWSTLTFHMLGLDGSYAAEFDKAGISARTVRIGADGKVKESLSLNPFIFKDLASETRFEQSDLYQYFDETRFFFVLYVMNEEGHYQLQGARFWSMPRADLEVPLKECWTRTRDIIRNGVSLTKRFGKNGSITVENNLPGSSENRVAHVRPHASKRAYKLADGTELGDIHKDGDELPDGQWMTKQSFWLNNDYIYEIVSDIS